MAYNCKTTQCDNNAATSCGRILRFSNPDYTFEVSDGSSKAVGNSLNNVAGTINANRATVAAFYPSRATDCTQDSDCNDNDPCTHDKCTFAGSCTNVRTCPTDPPTTAPSRCPAGEVAVDVEIKTDYYPCDTSWELEDLCGRGNRFTNTVQFNNKNEQTHEALCIPNGKYKFTLHDYYGDGIWGSDCYNVKVENVVVGSCPAGSFTTRSHEFGSC